MSVIDDFDATVQKDAKLNKAPSKHSDDDKKNDAVKDEGEQAKAPFAKNGDKKAKKAKGDSQKAGKVDKSIEEEGTAVEQTEEITNSDLQKSFETLQNAVEKSIEPKKEEAPAEPLATQAELAKSVDIFAKAYDNMKTMHDEVIASNEKLAKSLEALPTVEDIQASVKKSLEPADIKAEPKEEEPVAKSVAPEKTVGEGTKQEEAPVEKSVDYVPASKPVAETDVEAPVEKSVKEEKAPEEKVDKSADMTKRELVSKFNDRMYQDLESGNLSISDQNVVKSLARVLAYRPLNAIPTNDLKQAVDYANGK